MLKFNEQGLIPTIIQDANSDEILMFAFMNTESLRLTLEKGTVWFWSRSRQELWNKGATSGNYLTVREIQKDCDEDALLIKAAPAGPVCHTGNRSCFYRSLDPKDIEG
jgi:phosphoribosyl-AMP cyclohydrolase